MFSGRRWQHFIARLKKMGVTGAGDGKMGVIRITFNGDRKVQVLRGTTDEWLDWGKLDQIFPINKLQYPLPASDMAALAVKAISVRKRSERKRGCAKIGPTVSKIRSQNMNGEESEKLKSKDVAARKIQHLTLRRRGLTNKTWKRKLSTIEEGFSV